MFCFKEDFFLPEIVAERPLSEQQFVVASVFAIAVFSFAAAFVIAIAAVDFLPVESTLKLPFVAVQHEIEVHFLDV